MGVFGTTMATNNSVQSKYPWLVMWAAANRCDSEDPNITRLVNGIPRGG